MTMARNYVHCDNQILPIALITQSCLCQYFIKQILFYIQILHDGYFKISMSTVRWNHTDINVCNHSNTLFQCIWEDNLVKNVSCFQHKTQNKLNGGFQKEGKLIICVSQEKWHDIRKKHSWQCCIIRIQRLKWYTKTLAKGHVLEDL